MNDLAATDPASTTHHDVVVIGAGPGGYVAAIRAAQLGRSVAIVEERYWGGVCLNVGCIPSKSLLRNAEIATIVTRQAAAFGLVGEMRADYAQAHARSRKVADGRAKGIRYLMEKNEIAQVEGRASFTGPNSIAVVSSDGRTSSLTFEHAIVATGARPRPLPGVATSDRVLTYEQLILADEIPASLIVIGAGAIGVELGYVMNAYGAQVTILEYADRVLPAEDKDISREVSRSFRKQKIDIVTSAKVDSVREVDGSVTVDWVDASGADRSASAAAVLVATGFEPNTDGLGLDAAEIKLDESGAIVIDDQMRTSTPHIFAIGDVTMKLALAHVAEAMGVVAAEALAGQEPAPLGEYRMMPRATFAHPQVASFGLTEEQARAEHGEEIRVVSFPYSANGKAHGLGDASGLAKVVTKRDGSLLGGHIVGSEVAELLPELTLAQRSGLRVRDLARNVHVHPTMGEALQEVFHGLEGHMINL